MDVVVEKVFDPKLIPIFVVVTDADRNFYFEYFLAFVSIGLNSILLDIASRGRVVYERFQVMGSNHQSI